MSPSELEEWLKDESSISSGWAKDDGSGETVGHESYVPSFPLPLNPWNSWSEFDVWNSGRKIIEILKKNPKKDPEKYDEG